jgi:hypothetical protein
LPIASAEFNKGIKMKKINKIKENI